MVNHLLPDAHLAFCTVALIASFKVEQTSSVCGNSEMKMSSSGEICIVCENNGNRSKMLKRITYI